MPLSVAGLVFEIDANKGNFERARRAIGFQISDSLIELVGDEEKPYAIWQTRQVLAEKENWAEESGYFLRITSAGAELV